VQVLPPLPPELDFFPTPSQPQPIFPPLFFGIGTPRVLFVSSDDASLVQLQSDRLYFNWRRRSASTYPHYASVRDGFAKAYAAFEAVIADDDQGMVEPIQSDVFYTNPLPLSEIGVGASSPEKVFTSWNIGAGDEWQNPLEDLSFNARYRLIDEAGQISGRLVATMSTISADQMQFVLTARGIPKAPNLDGAIASLDIGHVAIVRCFTAMTTKEMHERWGRYDHE
jgi:uncharacterized protein (TIGR04255 family)